MSVIGDLILKSTKIVIPKSLRPTLLEQLHVGHMGVEKRSAKNVSRYLILNCSVCLKRRNSNAKEPLQPHKIPEYPWQSVATVLFSWEGNDYVIVVDYYSP